MLHNVSKMSRSGVRNITTKELLRNSSNQCDTQKRFLKPPVQLKTLCSTKMEQTDRDEFYIDVVLLGKRRYYIWYLLRLIYLQRHFSTNTVRVMKNSLEEVTTTLLNACLMYIKYQNRLRTVRGSTFASEHWKKLKDMYGVQ